MQLEQTGNLGHGQELVGPGRRVLLARFIWHSLNLTEPNGHCAQEGEVTQAPLRSSPARRTLYLRPRETRRSPLRSAVLSDSFEKRARRFTTPPMRPGVPPHMQNLAHRRMFHGYRSTAEIRLCAGRFCEAVHADDGGRTRDLRLGNTSRRELSSDWSSAPLRRDRDLLGQRTLALGPATACKEVFGRRANTYLQGSFVACHRVALVMVRAEEQTCRRRRASSPS
jgi:hypothetical protein